MRAVNPAPPWVVLADVTLLGVPGSARAQKPVDPMAATVAQWFHCARRQLAGRPYDRGLHARRLHGWARVRLPGLHDAQRRPDQALKARTAWPEMDGLL